MSLGRTWKAISDTFGMNRRNVELVYPRNARRDLYLADDKLAAKERLAAHGVPVPGTVAVCRGLRDIPRTLEVLDTRGNVVLKPASGAAGNGVMLLGPRTRGGWEASRGVKSRAELEHHLANIVFGAFSSDISDHALVEERVQVDPAVLALSGRGVADIRVLTLDGEAFLAMLRVPTLGSAGRANLHQGAIGVAVELSSGHTTRARHVSRAVTHHPDTGASLLGITVPRWRDVVQVAVAAARAVPLGFLGVDILLDRSLGPLVVEINARPGLEIQNIHGVGLGRALAQVKS